MISVLKRLILCHLCTILINLIGGTAIPILHDTEHRRLEAIYNGQRVIGQFDPGWGTYFQIETPLDISGSKVMIRVESMLTSRFEWAPYDLKSLHGPFPHEGNSAHTFGNVEKAVKETTKDISIEFSRSKRWQVWAPWSSTNIGKRHLRS